MDYHALDGEPGSQTLPVPGRKGESLKPIPEDALILVPLRNAVLFPGVISPVTVGRESSVAAARAAAKGERKIGFLLQRDPAQNEVGPDDVHRTGTGGQIVRYVAGGEGAHHLVIQGEKRFQVLEFLEGWPFLVASVAWIAEADDTGPEIEARFLQLKGRSVEAIHLLPHFEREPRLPYPGAPDELAGVVQAVESPALLADMVANLIDVTNEEKQSILETL